jgi:hypothetical protein
MPLVLGALADQELITSGDYRSDDTNRMRGHMQKVRLAGVTRHPSEPYGTACHVDDAHGRGAV